MGKMERGESGLSYWGGGTRGEVTYLTNWGREASAIPWEGREREEEEEGVSGPDAFPNVDQVHS